MSSQVLDGLLSEDLHANACAYSTARGLHGFLTQRAEVAAVREGLRGGTIAEEAVRSFVEHLLQGLRPGVLFAHDTTLAALAAACGDVATPFAEALLRELAELRLAETPMAPRVAREALRRPSAVGSPQAQPGGRPLAEPLRPEPAHPTT